jgi:hypothetical protein
VCLLCCCIATVTVHTTQKTLCGVAPRGRSIERPLLINGYAYLAVSLPDNGRVGSNSWATDITDCCLGNLSTNRRPACGNGAIKRVEPTTEQLNVVSPMQSVQSYKRRTVSERSKVEKEAVRKGSGPASKRSSLVRRLKQTAVIKEERWTSGVASAWKEDIPARSVISAEWYNCYKCYNCW